MIVEGNTYLIKNIKYSTQDLTEVTIIMITETSYKLRWNLNPNLPYNWMTISDFNSSYKVIEDITIKKNQSYLNFDISSNKLSYITCPNCQGLGVVDDIYSTSKKSVCPLCFGSKTILSKIETSK